MSELAGDLALLVLAVGSGPAWWNVGLGSVLLVGGVVAVVWYIRLRA